MMYASSSSSSGLSFVGASFGCSLAGGLVRGQLCGREVCQRTTAFVQRSGHSARACADGGPSPHHDRKRHREGKRMRPTTSTWEEVFASRPFNELRVGGIVVPRHLWNSALRRRGVFRSVEYTVLRLRLDGKDIQSTSELSVRQRRRVRDIVATIRPIGVLLPKFERFCSWPVDVRVGTATLWSYKRDLAQCFAVTLTTAASTLLFGLYAPNLFSFYFIPSLSMYPTFNVGDAVFVQKSPVAQIEVSRGDIVFFRAPPRLLAMIRELEEETRTTNTVQTNGGSGRHGGPFFAFPLHLNHDSQDGFHAPPSVRRRDLFVKRVVAVPGDVLAISNNSVVVNGVQVSEAAPGSTDCPGQRIPDGFLYVLGDDPGHSLDSRYWGLLSRNEVVGKPVYRIWPPDRVSSVH